MPEDIVPLVVWCLDRRAGALTQTTNGMRFAYTAEWVADGMPPLSQSLPLDGGFEAAAAAAFFGGLLPEGEPRRHLARLLGVSDGNDYSMLAMTRAIPPARSASFPRVRGLRRPVEMSSGSTTPALPSS